MVKRSLGRLVGPIASGLSNPAALFGGATVVVFLAASSASWRATSNARAATVGGSCMPAYNSCVSPGTSPCTTTGCSPTGSGYTCNIGGGQNVTEVHWKVQPVSANSWPLCWPVTNNTAPTCGGFWQSCGTTLHYPTKDVNCNVTCAGTWSWLGCQAQGTPCGGGGTGGGGGGTGGTGS